MNRDDIIRMAREAGFEFPADYDLTEPISRLERFAALVAAAEREKVAAWMIQRSYATGHGDTTEDLLNELDWQIAERIAAEREACAKVCETEAEKWEGKDGPVCFEVRLCSDAIRARGEK